MIMAVLAGVLNLLSLETTMVPSSVTIVSWDTLPNENRLAELDASSSTNNRKASTPRVELKEGAAESCGTKLVKLGADADMSIGVVDQSEAFRSPLWVVELVPPVAGSRTCPKYDVVTVEEEGPEDFCVVLLLKDGADGASPEKTGASVLKPALSAAASPVLVVRTMSPCAAVEEVNSATSLLEVCLPSPAALLCSRAELVGSETIAAAVVMSIGDVHCAVEACQEELEAARSSSVMFLDVSFENVAAQVQDAGSVLVGRMLKIVPVVLV